MNKESELKLGTEHEAEHVKTMKMIASDAKAGKLKPWKYYQKFTAKDHLKKIKDYYTRLERMEKQAVQKASSLIQDAFDMVRFNTLNVNVMKTVEKVKKLYNKVFGAGSYDRILVPKKVKESKAKHDINVSPEQKPEMLSSEKHYRHKLAKKKLAAYAGTKSHYAAGIVGQVEEKMKRKKGEEPKEEKRLAASINLIDEAIDMLKGKGGEGSRGGRVIGHTRTGKPIYQGGHISHKSFTINDNYDAALAKLYNGERMGAFSHMNKIKFGGLGNDEHKALLGKHFKHNDIGGSMEKLTQKIISNKFKTPIQKKKTKE